MLTDSERAALDAMVSQDPRSWARLDFESPRLGGGRLAHLEMTNKRAADSIVAEIRALGLDIEVLPRIEERVYRADGAEVVNQIVFYFVAVSGAVGIVAKMIKDLNEIPDGLKKLLERLRRDKNKVRLHEVFDLPAINRWLDEEFGEQRWKYDPEGLETKTVGYHTVYALTELGSGCQLLLVVRDGEVEGELTVKRRALPAAAKE